MPVSRMSSYVGTPSPPIGLRLAAIACVATGFYSGLGRIAVAPTWLAGHNDVPAWPLLLADLTGACLLLVAGVLIWLRRRVGVVVILASVALSAIVRLTVGLPIRSPGWPLLAALALIAANIRRLH